jgi:hypothetical protein
VVARAAVPTPALGCNFIAGDPKAVPTAKVVKAFNTIFARVLGAAPDRTQAQVLYAGDDAGAKAAERALTESAGFEAVDAGPLANARLLEPCGMLNIYFGYAAGRETGIALVWIPVAWAAIAASNVPSNQRPGAGWRPQATGR